MVRLLDRYVWKELVPPFAIGVGVFTFFLIIDRIYQLTSLVITKNVPFQLVLSLLVFLLPAFLSLTLPMALLVAVLLVGGRLAGDLEVAALKAAGVSPLRLFRPFVVAALLVTVLIGWLTLVVVPWSIGAFQQQLFKILQSRAATGITERTFTSAFGQFVDLRRRHLSVAAGAAWHRPLRRARSAALPHRGRPRGTAPHRRGEPPHHPALSRRRHQ